MFAPSRIVALTHSSIASLSRFARKVGIAYVFLGAELGARTPDKNCYENGRVKYERIARTAMFAEVRSDEGLSKYRVSLMCAEKEPLDCIVQF